MSLKSLQQQRVTNRKVSFKGTSRKNTTNLTTTVAIRGPSGGGIAFLISPAVNGKSTWDILSDGDLNLSASANGTWVITPLSTFTANVVMWGAGGGATYNQSAGAGGASNGLITFEAGVEYDFIVGSGGNGGAGNRDAGAGGAGSGIQFKSNTTPIMVAGGGGGGAGAAAPSAGAAGGGGGSSGQDGISGDRNFGFTTGGRGASQSAAGGSAPGSRRTGAGGSGRNGGGLNTGSLAYAGGVGFGNGGGGAYNGGDQGSGGGGGGYWGGGEGGGDAGGFGGGGGSGYINPVVVAGGTTTQANYATAALNTDAKRGTAGTAGNASRGANGAIYMTAA
jgi:hypothetical protein